MADEKNKKPKIKIPNPHPEITRAMAEANMREWSKKYRLNPRQRGKEYRYDRAIQYDGQITVVPLAYLDEIYGHITPMNIRGLFLIIQKPRQARISEFCINTALYTCDVIPGFTMVYVFPDDKTARRFLLKRIDEPINDSDYLSFVVSSVGMENIHRAKKKGVVDSLDIKKLGLSWFYMLASMSKSASRSPDADGVLFDEYDIHDMEKEESFTSTMDDSEYRTKVYISTPTEPNFGIELRYKQTSMAKWIVNCGFCYEDFEMNSEYFFGVGLKLLPEARESDNAERIYICPHCGVEITPLDKMIRGRWVHEHPGMKKYNRYGYQFSNLILPHIDASRAYSDYKDFSVKPGGVRKFYNEKLGESQSSEEKSARFQNAVMRKCCVKGLKWTDLAYNTMMGIDWGKETHVVIWKYYEQKLRLINFHVFPHNPEPLGNAKKVMKLMPFYNPDVVVGDYGGGQEDNKYLFERIPKEKFFMAVHRNDLKELKPHWDKKIQRVYYELVTAYSTYARWYPAEIIELPEYDEKVEYFIKHHTNSCLINPNERKAADGVLVVIGRDEPQTVGHIGPIHTLSASLFGWLQCMGMGASDFHFSAPPKRLNDTKNAGDIDTGAESGQNRALYGIDKSGVKLHQP